MGWLSVMSSTGTASFVVGRGKSGLVEHIRRPEEDHFTWPATRFPNVAEVWHPPWETIENIHSYSHAAAVATGRDWDIKVEKSTYSASSKSWWGVGLIMIRVEKFPRRCPPGIPRPKSLWDGWKPYLSWLLVFSWARINDTTCWISSCASDKSSRSGAWGHAAQKKSFCIFLQAWNSF